MKANNRNHLGIDFGSNLAGTTAICQLIHQSLHIECSKAKRSADDFLVNYISQANVDCIFIDAPLSLPSAYFGPGTDYFYRNCDRALKAMSPMFLGGLTARAISLKNNLSEFSFYETYPKAMVNQIFDPEHYKKELNMFVKQLEVNLPFPISTTPSNWHMIDSVLAWYAGYRFFKGVSKIYGHIDEGLIYI